jgi:hypothetical protein
MRATAFIFALLTSSSAFAHQAPAVHMHPHGDWAIAGLALLAGGVAALAFAARRVKRGRARK